MESLKVLEAVGEVRWAEDLLEERDWDASREAFKQAQQILPRFILLDNQRGAFCQVL